MDIKKSLKLIDAYQKEIYMENKMLFTYETINEVVGFPISEDSFFSEGTVLMIDGCAWELVEVCGDQLVFAASDDIETAETNMEYFYNRVS